jgi:hypothetical protein
MVLLVLIELYYFLVSVLSLKEPKGNGGVMQKRWSCSPLFLQPPKVYSSPRGSRQSIERDLQDLQNAYARLLDEHASLWRTLVIGSLSNGGHGEAPQFGDELQELIEISIQEILSFCSEALSDLQNAPADSAESNKHTGKILAYGRVTAILHTLESRVRMRHSLHRTSTIRFPT